MWLAEEIEMCKAFEKSMQTVRLIDFLKEDDIEAIGDKPISFHNLRNRVLTPKGKSILMPSTVTFQHLWDEKLDFGKWLSDIASTVCFSTDTHVQVGFSFICSQPLTGEKIYIYAARSLAPFNFFADNKTVCVNNFDDIGQKSESELLNKVFVETEADNPFRTSGYCPLKLVCTYVWIRK